MIKYVAAFLSIALFGYCAGWAPYPPAPFNLILPSAVTTSDTLNVILTYNSLTGEILATWGDQNNSNAPTYSFFNAGSWSYDPLNNTPTEISATSQVASDVITCFNPDTGEFLATWTDRANSYYPTYSLYSPNSGWSAINTITTSSAVGGDSHIFNVYVPGKGYFAAWKDSVNNDLYFSIYDGVSWSTIAPIATDANAQSVFLSCDPSTGTVLATWKGASNYPYYSFYTDSSWGSANSITTSSNVQQEVQSCFDPSTGQFLAVWATFSGANNPIYSFGNTMASWTSPQPITTASGADTNVTLSQNPSSGEILAMWLDETTGSPAYSFYNGSTWSTETLLSPFATSNYDDCYSCYSSATNQFFAGWTDVNNFPNYSVYSFSSTVAPLQPASLSGMQKVNNFGVVKERYNVLTWQSSEDATSYSISRNGVLIATLGANAIIYEDHDQPTKNQLYSVVAANAYGSSPAALVIVGE